ncbi:MAG: sigma-70 family RNA polymerase sigma factor [Phaeodactylibacter sp.]|nr:sigma-70 family RNA polymerase sigma factor [Phaeodactylibacter sp.]
MTQDEQQLVQELQNGNQQAVAWLYDKYAAVLYGVALRIVGTEAEAEDVVQEAFIKIWKHIGSYAPDKGTFFTWILNITRNTGIDRLRSKGFRQQSMIQELQPFVYKEDGPQTSINPDTLDLKHHVQQLDPKYREIIELFYFQGYTQKEVEDELEIPIGTVKSRIRIALRELRKVFKAGLVLELLFFLLWLS